jgi:alkanesulfonate monooxygenase SsuD/methylene tetrahydromethanopterin reductase-like flavin-dependent oxidoreductase (luciferase family)
MKFGFMGWLQLPKPWGPDSEYRLWKDGLEQIDVCDRIGIDHLWQIEHHFLEEFSHSSAGETFLAAASQRTKRIRLGSGITLLPPAYNHPARVAERVAALDIISDGRAEFGTGESTSFTELAAFHVSRTDKRAMWREALVAICRMMVEEPFRGHQGKYFEMPPRNVIPKPVQKPHPPVWVACSRQETIMMAAKLGLGALTFGFVSADEARTWTTSYYEELNQCVPITYRVNPNVGFLMTCVCDRDGERARRVAEANYFAMSGLHYYVDGEHKPGKTNLWEMQQSWTLEQRQHPFANAIGSPAEVGKVMLEYEAAGVDQLILVVQFGKMEHQYICESLELLGKTVIPEFKEREEQRAQEKARKLEPVIEAAMKRKVEPQTPWYSEDYSYQSDGSTVTHFGLGPDTFANAERADNRPASQAGDPPAARAGKPSS